MPAEQTFTEPAQPLHAVLVVDDEILVRTVVAEYLRDCGYQVIEAANAAEALEVLTSDLNVDVLFTDIDMPGELNGFGLAKWTRENRPGLQILLTSGNPSKAHEARDLCLDEHFVSKPTPFDDLRDRIARILASRTEP